MQVSPNRQPLFQQNNTCVCVCVCGCKLPSRVWCLCKTKQDETKCQKSKQRKHKYRCNAFSNCASLFYGQSMRFLFRFFCVCVFENDERRRKSVLDSVFYFILLETIYCFTQWRLWFAPIPDNDQLLPRGTKKDTEKTLIYFLIDLSISLLICLRILWEKKKDTFSRFDQMESTFNPHSPFDFWFAVEKSLIKARCCLSSLSENLKSLATIRCAEKQATFDDVNGICF